MATPKQVEEEDDSSLPFVSRRSPIVCCHAAVATSQPLASSIGLDLLRKGANAADAAVAIAAALAVTEPCSTGLGGDMFCLYYDKGTVSCVNGSGKSPKALTLERLETVYPDGSGGVNVEQFRDSPLSVTVPGAAAGWEAVWQRHGSGKFSFAELLEPAAVLAEEGFPVAPVTAYHWKAGMSQITQWLRDDESAPLAKSGTLQTPPSPGDIVVNPDLARVLRELGREGATKGFYQSATGRAIAEIVQKHGGCLTVDDLAAHTTTFPVPVAVEYRGCQLWQVPPNGQGIAGLIALSGLGHLEDIGALSKNAEVGSADWYHCMIEMMRLGFADACAHVADPDFMQPGQVDCLLDTERIRKRALTLYDPQKATIAGVPDASSCTVSFQVIDDQGGAISFVNSNYMGFGTGIMPTGCGFTLQNRGFGFALEPGHPNVVAPCKRPFHTIIPGMLTHSDTNELYATMSNMGGTMQPQGHLQLTLDLLAGNLDPQAAIDRPRFCIADGTQDGVVFLEDGIDNSVVEELRQRGHVLKAGVQGQDRSVFGRAQIIKRDRSTGVLWAGSDGRADGCAIGF